MKLTASLCVVAKIKVPNWLVFHVVVPLLGNSGPAVALDLNQMFVLNLVHHYALKLLGTIFLEFLVYHVWHQVFAYQHLSLIHI